jgi:molybdopterin converting factor small subunit
MRVTVKLFARLRDLAGRGEIPCTIAAPATIADVWRALVAMHPALGPHAQSVSAARNAAYARMTTPVADGDDIAFLPPVSGG